MKAHISLFIGLALFGRTRKTQPAKSLISNISAQTLGAL